MVSAISREESAMSVGKMLWIIFGVGAVGGLLNAYLSTGRLEMPRRAIVDDNVRVWIPGFIGNMIIGGVAAAISWGLYGPLSSMALFKSPTPGTLSPVDTFTLATVMGAVLVGIGGARWLTNEIDKKLLHAAAGKAAAATQNQNAAQQIMLASPAEALNIARGL